MKNKDFQEWLTQFPDDAEIQVLTETEAKWGYCFKTQTFDPEKRYEQWDYNTPSNTLDLGA